jgi:hypothetical protein
MMMVSMVMESGSYGENAHNMPLRRREVVQCCKWCDHIFGKGKYIHIEKD